MALSPQWLDALRARITLSALIGRSVRLTKAGREFRACCPFHDEKSPSFYVNDSKGFYHCFGCQAHGDAIRWLTDHQGLAFMDAVKELASEAGMEVPAPDPRAAKQAQKRAGLHDVTEAAQAWFVDKLRGADGAEARGYLARRGISDATAREFGFGYAPDERQALPRSLKFDEALLVEAGMRIAPEEDGKEHYDRFRGRLMLPIHNARGQVIAFGGRTLAKDAGGAKYLNSPDTPLFDKGRTLYNLHRSAPAARKSGRIVVVEGYMDVIALAQAGIAEAVAPMGTALTEHQLELLWRQVERPILCFDGDAAGQRAALKGIARALPLLRPGHSLGIVRLPEGLDPDDLVRQQGAAAMEALLAAPQPLADALWQFEQAAAPLASPEDKAGLKARLIEHVDTIQHPDIRALYRRELLEKFSAFAYPPRPSNVVRLDDKRQRPDEEAWRVKWQAREIRLYKRLGAALVAGTLLHSTEISPHVDSLYAVYQENPTIVDPRLIYFADNLLDFDGDKRTHLEAMLSGAGFALPEPKDWDEIKFPFTLPFGDEDRARSMLNRAFELYCQLPLVRVALSKATANLKRSETDGNWDDQRRLVLKELQLKAEFQALMAA